MDATSIDPTSVPQTTSSQPKDDKPIIPLRQRQLPASFWQEPTSARDPALSIQSNHTGMDPWFMNTTTSLPSYIPQRLAALPNGYLHHPSTFATPAMWMRSPLTCNCTDCLNYSMAFRVPEVYGLRYNPGLACCPVLNCADQSCKLCAATAERWHPDRLRQIRLRSARYNAIVD